LIHNIDECCWMKDAWPVQAKGAGGRHFRGKYIDQNFDVYSVEYTFADGAKLLMEGRNIPGCNQEFASYAHGTKGSAIISTVGHPPPLGRINRAKNITKKTDLVWAFPHREPTPYHLEGEPLPEAIRQNRPYTEVKRGAEPSLIPAMGRVACH